MGKLQNLIGKKINLWTVIKRAPTPAGSHHSYWECKCDCGTIAAVTAASLRDGRSRSCGCRRKEICRTLFTTHKDAESKEYRAWSNLKNRCSNPNYECYKTYGGRGIKVCKRWLNSYENFLEDMGRAPSKRHSIDRKNNDKNYTPSNCRWATPVQQANNKTNNRFFTHNGITLSLSEWALKLNINPKSVFTRIYKGWSEEKALFEPFDIRFSKKKKFIAGVGVAAVGVLLLKPN